MLGLTYFYIEGHHGGGTRLCVLIYIRGFPNMVETYKLKPLRAYNGEKRFLLSIREKPSPEPQTSMQNAPDLSEILPDQDREVGAPSLMQLRRRKLPLRVRVVRLKVVQVKHPLADPRLQQFENYHITRNRSKHTILTHIPAVFAHASLIPHLRKSVSTV